VKPRETPLPGFESVFSEIISKIPRKRKRGRPQKYASPKHRAELKSRTALILGMQFKKRVQEGGKLTVRQQQNHILAERAWNILTKSENAQQLLARFVESHTLLAELGRIERKDWLIRTAGYIAYHGLRGEIAREEIRRVRFGKRWATPSILFRKLWKALAQYRHLFPHMEDEEAKKDFDHAAASISEDLALKISISKRTTPAA
jgi:hypothetical protein